MFKRCVEVFHQMGLLTSYKQIRRALQGNCKAVKAEIVEKVGKKRFYISYDNMNFQENACNQQIFNRGELFSYIADFLCFIKTLESLKNLCNTWKKRYFNFTEIDRSAVNLLKQKDFLLGKTEKSYCSSVNCFIISKVMGRYCSKAMQYQRTQTPDGK